MYPKKNKAENFLATCQLSCSKWLSLRDVISLGLPTARGESEGVIVQTFVTGWQDALLDTSSVPDPARPGS